MNTEIESVDKYIQAAPSHTRDILRELRKIVQHIAPEAEEMIRYGMPTYKIDGKVLVHFAGYEKHIGVYPTPVTVAEFENKIKGKYKYAKGSIQLPIENTPLDLFTEIVNFRYAEIEG